MVWVCGRTFLCGVAPSSSTTALSLLSIVVTTRRTSALKAITHLLRHLRNERQFVIAGLDRATRPHPARVGIAQPRMPRPQPIFRGRIAAQVQRRRRACAPVALLVQRGSHLTEDHTCRSTIMRLISAIALAGLRLFGQALAQFMMVWQR